MLGDDLRNLILRSDQYQLQQGKLSDRSPLKDLNYSINQDSNQVNLSIPTPFKRALFWTPSQDKKKDIKRNAKEKIPAVASSAQWQEYHQKKEAKKQLEILEKEEKKQQRLQKQKEREESKKKSKIPRKKQKKPEESSPEASSKSDMLNISTTDGGKECTVKTMTSSGHNWKWPQMEDILNYEEDDVIKHIGKPKLINKRGVYEVPEYKV
ncbi:hypothetical protein RI129_000024 [Pyrocoelia pectoralis]|uniref:Uncharacterized protein n=1 Tax=Pyrocoelia pectoralis TaxID=417401 RepID=A0AAN7V1V5_9COLE